VFGTILSRLSLWCAVAINHSFSPCAMDRGILPQQGGLGKRKKLVINAGGV
jgi:hypothetical protein